MPPMLMLEVEKGLTVRGVLPPMLMLEVEKGLKVRGGLAVNVYAGGRERVKRSCRQYLCWRQRKG